MVGGIAFFVNMLQTLALVPILLIYWGTAKYGLWLTLMAGFSLLQTLDLGHQNYIGNQLNVQYHNKFNQFQRTLGSSLYIAYFLGFIELIICLILVATDSLSMILSVPSESLAEHQMGLGFLLLMAMWFTFGSVGGIVVRIMIPVGMLYQSQWIGIGMRLSQFFSIACVAFTDGSILMACFWYSVTQSLLSFSVFWYLRKILPQFFPWWRGGHWSDGFKALKRSLVLTFINIGNQLANNGLLILIAALFTAAVIPSFATLRTLTNTAGAVTTILITALLPDMIRFHATRERDKLNSVFSINWFVGGMFVNFGLILVLPFIEPLYRFWTKGQLAFDAPLFFLLAAAISLVNFGAGLRQYLEGINDLRAQTLMTLGRAGILFGVGILLHDHFGILSIGIGYVAAELMSSVVLPILFVNRRLAELTGQLSVRQVLQGIIPPFSLLFTGCYVSVYHLQLLWVTVLMLPVLIFVYYLTWKGLGKDLQHRILRQVNPRLNSVSV